MKNGCFLQSMPCSLIEKWLLSSINEQGIENIQDIFLGEYVNGELNLTIYPKIV